MGIQASYNGSPSSNLCFNITTILPQCSSPDCESVTQCSVSSGCVYLPSQRVNAASAEPTHFKSKVKPPPVGTCSILATSLLFTEFPVLDAGLPLLSRMPLSIKAIFMNASTSLLRKMLYFLISRPSYSPLPWMQRKLNNSK